MKKEMKWICFSCYRHNCSFVFIIMKAVQREREEKLARFLKDFLNQYVSGDKEGFFHHAEAEAKRLANTGQ